MAKWCLSIKKKVVRFSGSEIFKDAEKCVEDLLDILNR